MDTLINYLTENSYIDKNEQNFIRYGIEVFILNSISVISILMISFLTKNIIIGISFIINFVIVRTHLGGFHCQKPLNCIVIFPIIYFCTIRFLGILDFYTMSLVAIIILIIMLFVKPIRNNTCIEEKFKNKFSIIHINKYIFVYLWD